MHFNPLNPNQANVVLDRYWKMFYSQTRDYEEEGMIMRNFIFISPHFPTNYENFCVQLHENGVNVFGIGDTPYENPVSYTHLDVYKRQGLYGYKKRCAG